MREEIIINAPTNAKYISEFLKTLPLGVLNKVNTGCGATTLAIENPENAIICCPTINLVKNKEKQYPNKRCEYKVLGVMGGVRNSDITNYIRECESHSHPIKILVTYNSFERVTNALGKRIHEFKVVVDEFQEIINGAFYRNVAMHSLLVNLRGLSLVTFLSATPIPHQYLPKEIAKMESYKINWAEQKENVKIIPIKSSSPFSTAINLIVEHKVGGKISLDGDKPEKLFFFVNSVSAISTIIRKTNLKPEEVNIICADNIKNNETLKDFEVGTVPLEGEPHKPFTFCTKTVFCGADFHSKDGLCVVVSDNRHTSTVLDIAVDIKQIAGRIRTQDNPFRGMVLHIFDTRESSEEEFYEELNEIIDRSERVVHSYNTIHDEIVRSILQEYSSLKREDEDLFLFFNEDKNIMELDQLKIDSKVYQFQNVAQIYGDSSTIEEFYRQQGYEVDTIKEIAKEIETFSRTISRAPTLKRICIEYYSLKEQENSQKQVEGIAEGVANRILELEDIQDFLPDFYKYLTLEELESLRFNITDMKDELYFRKAETQEAIKVEIRKIFKAGERYSNKDTKAKQQIIYDNLGIRKKATAKGLSRYADIKEGIKINVEGKRRDGILVTKVLLIKNKVLDLLLQNRI